MFYFLVRRPGPSRLGDMGLQRRLVTARSRDDHLQQPADLFYGDRRAGVKDAWNNHWWLATHVEDVSPEQLRQREAEFRTTSTGSNR